MKTAVLGVVCQRKSLSRDLKVEID